MQLLTFKVGPSIYGLETFAVNEIVRPVKVTKIWGLPESVLGVSNIRGVVVVVIDIATILGTEANSMDDSLLLVINSGDERVAVRVDEVKDVVSVEDKSVQPPPRNLDERISKLISGVTTVNGELVTLLDINAVLKDEALTVMK